ncbi:hypothetical protein ACFLYO_04395 [Chloroflexota bacterium]
MSDMKQNRVHLNPDDVQTALQQLALVYDLDADTLDYLRRVIEIYPRQVLMYVDEANAPFYNHTPLVDKFTFNMHTDELILFSRDPMTFIDAMIEMVMYLAGFTTMMGVDEHWKVEFAIGSWKPVKNRAKSNLGIPVLDEPLWIVGLPPPPEEAPLEDEHPFRTLVSQLDIVSFTQMIRLAARDDVEVNFPVGADPRVIEIYIRVKTAMDQVADGIALADWREFNHRLLLTVQEIEEEYRPERLPVPVWWKRQVEDLTDMDEEPELVLSGEGNTAEPGSPPDAAPSNGVPESLPESDGQKLFDEQAGQEESNQGSWNPFAAYIDELFNNEE